MHVHPAGACACAALLLLIICTCPTYRAGALTSIQVTCFAGSPARRVRCAGGAVHGEVAFVPTAACSGSANVSATACDNTSAPPATMDSTGTAVTGSTAGALPNVYFRSVSMEAVRADPAFRALPPVEHLTIASPQCYRWAPPTPADAARHCNLCILQSHSNLEMHGPMPWLRLLDLAVLWPVLCWRRHSRLRLEPGGGARVCWRCSAFEAAAAYVG